MVIVCILSFFFSFSSFLFIELLLLHAHIHTHALHPYPFKTLPLLSSSSSSSSRLKQCCTIDHLIASPLAFANTTQASKFWVKFSDIPALQHPSIRTTQGSITHVDTVRKLATIKSTTTGETLEHSYDYFIAATGLRRVWPVVPQSLTREEYLLETSEHVRSVQNATEGVVVIGGGAVGIEMAAELKLMEPQLRVTLVHSRDKLLSAEPLPDDVREAALKCLKEGGVDVILGRGRVLANSTTQSEDGKSLQKLTLQDGSHLTASHVISAVSAQLPTTSYLPSQVLDEEGLVKIDPEFKFLSNGPNHERHFAIGDIARWSGIKRCGGAMAMGHRAAETVHKQILNDRANVGLKIEPWPEMPPMIALAVGKKAVVYDPTAGCRYGEDQMKIFFDDDLGFKGCWNHLSMSEPWTLADSKTLPEATCRGETAGVAGHVRDAIDAIKIS